jgi:hypothetical protein
MLCFMTVSKRKKNCSVVGTKSVGDWRITFAVTIRLKNLRITLRLTTISRNEHISTPVPTKQNNNAPLLHFRSTTSGWIICYQQATGLASNYLKRLTLCFMAIDTRQRNAYMYNRNHCMNSLHQLPWRSAYHHLKHWSYARLHGCRHKTIKRLHWTSTISINYHTQLNILPFQTYDLHLTSWLLVQNNKTVAIRTTIGGWITWNGHYIQHTTIFDARHMEIYKNDWSATNDANEITSQNCVQMCIYLQQRRKYLKTLSINNSMGNSCSSGQWRQTNSGLCWLRAASNHTTSSDKQ